MVTFVKVKEQHENIIIGTNCTGSIEHLPKLFESVVYNDQMTVYNGNINSKIECFPKFDFGKEGYLGIKCLHHEIGDIE